LLGHLLLRGPDPVAAAQTLSAPGPPPKPGFSGPEIFLPGRTHQTSSRAASSPGNRSLHIGPK